MCQDQGLLGGASDGIKEASRAFGFDTSFLETTSREKLQKVVVAGSGT